MAELLSVNLAVPRANPAKDVGTTGIDKRPLIGERWRIGDEVVLLHPPDHAVTVGLAFRALTLEPELLAGLVDCADLPDDVRAQAARRAA